MDSFVSVKRKCEVVTLEHLPDEIIHDLLKLLDPKSLKATSAVNKR